MCSSLFMWDDFECAPRSLCAYSAERLFIISRLSHSAECDKRYFHRRGRGGKRQLPRLFPRGNSHAAGALRHGSQHDPLSHRCAMPDFPLSSLRASSPAPGEDVTVGDKRGNLARERLRGRGKTLTALPERVKKVGQKRPQTFLTHK